MRCQKADLLVTRVLSHTSLHPSTHEFSGEFTHFPRFLSDYLNSLLLFCPSGQSENLFLKKNESANGRLHRNSEIITDDEGNDWFFYHAWQKAKIDNGRQLMCDRIQWSSDGWPYITNGTPASVSRAPVFKNEEEKE